MKTFINIGFILSIIIFVSSCKKNSTSPSTATNPIVNPSAINYGVFTSQKSAIITNTLINMQPNSSNAFISNTTLINNSPVVGSLLDIGTVQLNGVVFQKNAYGLTNLYTDSTTSTYNTPHNWIISGTAAIPSFSFSNTNNYPTYTGYTAILDSITISNNISIPLTNYNGADDIETYFITMTNPVVKTSTQNIAGTTTALNFTSTDLSAIGVNGDVAIVVTFFKNNVQIINGNSYNFRTSYSIIKQHIKFK
jgi:hypothetical protein